jgi:hypothetical protein
MQNVGLLMAALAVLMVGCGAGRSALVVGGVAAYLLVAQPWPPGTIFGYELSNTVAGILVMGGYGLGCMVVVGVVIRCAARSLTMCLARNDTTQ